MPKQLKINIDEVMEAIESGEYMGFCVECGEAHDCVEPDARNYSCQACGAMTVFGAEQILLEFA